MTKELTAPRPFTLEDLAGAEEIDWTRAVVSAQVPAARAVEAAVMAEGRKPWFEIASEMKDDDSAAIGFRQTGNEIVAAAAFEHRQEIADGTMTGEMFTAMMKEINGIAKSYEARLGQPPEQKLAWPQVVDDMGRSNIAETAFETTGSRIVAAAGYRFRRGITTVKDKGASFKAMMRQINEAVEKYR